MSWETEASSWAHAGEESKLERGGKVKVTSGFQTLSYKLVINASELLPM